MSFPMRVPHSRRSIALVKFLSCEITRAIGVCPSFDLYVTEPTLKIILDKRRPPDRHDPYGVEQAQKRLDKTLTMYDEYLAKRQWQRSSVQNTFKRAQEAMARR